MIKTATAKIRKYLNVLCLSFLVLSGIPGMAQDFNLIWTANEQVNATLPPSIKVFETNTPLPGGVELHAQYALIDLEDRNLRFKAVQTTGSNSTPKDFADAEEDEVFVAINGGFFSGSSSLSLVLEGGQVLSPNLKALSRTFEGNPATYYPTRGAFGLSNAGEADVSWIYNVGTANETYSYPIPSPNLLGTAPQPEPSSTFPAGAALWDVHTAIGGSPVLLENGTIMITADEELLDVNNAGREPRSAIGYTADGTAILLVVDGRAPEFSLGVSLQELAQIMKEIGAVEALNLDGGGSSALVVNDEVYSKPSDAAGIRPVASALLVMQQNRIFDTEDANYVEIGGSWSETANAGFYGESKARFRAAGAGEKYGAYSFTDLEPAAYEISGWWVPSSNRSAQTPYIIAKDGLTNDTVRVNQSTSATANQFNDLGTFHLGPQDSLFISDLVSDGGLVTVDAIQVRKVGESAPLISFAQGAEGSHVVGTILNLDVIIQSPNSGVSLSNLKISVKGDDDLLTEISNEVIAGNLSFSKDFDYLIERNDQQLEFVFEVTDDRSRVVSESYLANIQAFAVNILPEVEILNVETRDQVDLTINAELPTESTTTLEELKVFRSTGDKEEEQVGSAITISGTTATVEYQYIVTDRANQDVRLRFEMTTESGQKSDKSITLRTTAKRGDMRIAVISDLNGSFGSVTYQENILQLMEKLPSLNPDFVICGGDMIAGQSTALSPADVDAMWNGFDEFIATPLKDAGLPFAFTMGNHDAAIEVDIEGAKRYWNIAENFPGYFPVDTTNYPFYQSFLEKEGGDFFMISWNASDANLSDEEIAWVREQLESDVAKNASYRFIIGHIPLYAVASERNGAGNVMSNADSLLSLMEELDVHTYFSGHHHAYYPAKRGNVDLFNAGAVGPGARNIIGSDLDPFNAFTLVDVFIEEDTLIYNTFRMPSSLPENLELFEEQELPEIVEGFNGFIIRRDINTGVDKLGDLSSFHLQNPNNTTASGTVEATFAGDQVTFSGSFSDLSSQLLEDQSTIAIYQGVHNTAGQAVFYPTITTSDGLSGTFHTTQKLSAAQKDLLAAGAFYVLIKTNAFPNGELRTQVYAESNKAQAVAVINTQTESDSLLIRDTDGVFPVEWTGSLDPESNPVTYTYQLSATADFEQPLINAGVGRATFYNLITEGLLLNFLEERGEGITAGSFFQRVVSSDGKHVVTGSVNEFRVKLTTAPNEGPVTVIAPNYIFNEAFVATTAASNGHGVTADLNGKVWYAPFSTAGLRVSNQDGTIYSPTSDQLTFSDSTKTTITSFNYEGEEIPIGGVRGLGLDEEGYVLIVISSTDIYRLDPLTGEPVAKWDGPTSLTNPTVDADGRVFVASVVGDRQFILERTGSTYTVVAGGSDANADGSPDGFSLPGRELARSSAISKDGKWIVVPANSGRNIHVFNSTDGLNFSPYQVIETVSPAGTNAVIGGENGKFWYIANRSALPPTLTFQDFEQERSWSLQLEEISSTDQRGLAFSEDMSHFYTVSSSNGSVTAYVLNDGTAPPIAEILTYAVNEVNDRKSNGMAEFAGEYVRVLGIINSQNFSATGVDISMEANNEGISVFASTALANEMAKGDSISVIGRIDQNAGLIRIVADSIKMLMADAQTIEYRAVSELVDSLESLPVEIAKAQLTKSSTWGDESNFLGFDVETAKEEQVYSVFVDKQSALYDQDEPKLAFDMRGIVRRNNNGNLTLYIEQNETAPELLAEQDDILVSEGFGSKQVDLKTVFGDVNNDPLNYQISLSMPGLVNTAINADILTFSEINTGTVEVTIVATDGKGGEAEGTFFFIVNSLPKLKNTINDVLLSAGFATYDIDLDSTFTDAEDTLLTLQAESEDPSIVTVNIVGTNLQIVEDGLGETNIVIEATDKYGAMVTTSFNVIVSTVTGTKSELDNQIQVFPVPSSVANSHEITIKSSLFTEIPNAYLVNVQGKIIQVEAKKVADNAYSFSLEELPDGLYYLVMNIKGTTITKTIVK